MMRLTNVKGHIYISSAMPSSSGMNDFELSKNKQLDEYKVKVSLSSLMKKHIIKNCVGIQASNPLA